MSYKYRFSELYYETKIRVILRFVLLFIGEQILNFFLYSWGISLSLFSFFLLIFTQKYFSVLTGYLWFILAIFVYNVFSPFSASTIVTIYSLAYAVAHLTDFEKLSALLFLYVQTGLFCIADREFCGPQIGIFLLVHTLFVAFAKLDIVPPKVKKKESVFL